MSATSNWRGAWWRSLKARVPLFFGTLFVLGGLSLADGIVGIVGIVGKRNAAIAVPTSMARGHRFRVTTPISQAIGPQAASTGQR